MQLQNRPAVSFAPPKALPAMLLATTKATKAPVAIDTGETWSESAVEKLHGILLEESLALLRDISASEAEVQEVLDWIYQPQYLAIVCNGPQRAWVRDYEVPFSFSRCCRLHGVDPEEIRERLPDILRRVKRPVEVH